jgi:mannonate dehydratase
MKVGLGLYRHMLTREYYDFARQAGCTHVVVHLVDYFNQGTTNPRHNQPTGAKYKPWGVAGDPEKLWTIADLNRLRRDIEDAGLIFAAIETLDPAHWYDILLDGPRRSRHIENVKAIIGRIGEARIPILGYNFSVAGVCGRVTTPSGRGRALTVGMDGPADDEPVPNGMVWNMIYDRNAPPGNLPAVSHEELWRRLQRFLEDVIPVAERSGVRLAAHPDDPPMSTMRGQPRLVYQPHMYHINACLTWFQAAPMPWNCVWEL